MAAAVLFGLLIGSGQASADNRSTKATIAPCSDSPECATLGGEVCFSWNPDYCDPDCHITPRINITGACAAVTSIALYEDNASTCPSDPAGTLVANLENLIPFTLTQAQTDDMLNENHVVKVQLANGAFGKDKPKKNTESCPALSETAVAAMCLLGIGVGAMVLRGLRARPQRV